ncbi:VIT1/CCC1 transporter family protein [Candidatus Gracilibacteria bacterium]|nr:VIT1/CCC1 transporter family protein [Candidatus Gracilibacteria bacterium]
MRKIAAMLKDMILGGQDGLVNVLGVILGLAAATSEIRIILAGGLAAAFAESISMAAVAYTSTLAYVEYYESEKVHESELIEKNPEDEVQEIRNIYSARGFQGKLLDQIVTKITSDKKRWVEVMMLEELRLSPATREGALKSSLVVGVAAMIGSLIPLSPFFFFSIRNSIIISIIFSTVVLFAAGAYKAKITVGSWWKSGLQLAIIGIVSALLGYYIGYLFQ